MSENNQQNTSMDAVSTDIFTCIPYLTNAFRAGLVPILRGAPGIGKSAAMQSIADQFNLKLVDLRLAQMDPTDLNGYPAPDLDKKRATFLVPDVFPIEGDDLPTKKDGSKYNGWLIFLDEISNAPNSVQGAAFKLILDRKIGQHKLHSSAVIAAAGNKETDRAAAGKLNTAMQSRLMHFDIKSSAEAWCAWAIENGIDSRIVAFISFKPELLNNFEPSHKDRTFACERTWEMTHKYLQALSPDGKSSSVKIDYSKHFIPFSGLLGKAAAMEFTLFGEIQVPDINLIIADPENAPYPPELDVRYALTGAVADRISENNIDSVIKYVMRMPIELQIITIRTAIKRIPSLRSNKSISKWLITNANRLEMFKKVKG